MNPRDEIDALRREVREHDRRYYVDAAPTVTDTEYDRLLGRLRELEAAHPEFASPDSPTQRVAGEPIDGFETVRHSRPMYSIDNTYDEAGLRKWGERCYELLSESLSGLAAEGRRLDERGDTLRGDTSTAAKEQRREIEAARCDLRLRREALIAAATEAGSPIDGGYFAEPKVDGVAVGLRYERGRLVLAATRGDGHRGDDITANARAVRSVPLVLEARPGGPPVPDVLEIRGEVYLPQAEFVRLNREAAAGGGEPMVNPRNGAAGTLKQHNPRVVARRGLRLMAHGRGEISGEPIATQSELLAALARWGLPTNPLARRCETLHDVWRYIGWFEPQKPELGYGVDGVVVKVDRFDQQQQLGHTSRFPRWCLAYKYATEQAATILQDVEWQMGKTGKLTPRGKLRPVFVAGTTVRHATLHNLGEVRRKDLHLGDTVIVEKAGEIIPQVVRALPQERPVGAAPVRPPTRCPECGGPTEPEYDNRRVADLAAWPARVQRERQRAERAGETPREVPQPPPLAELDESGRYCTDPSCPAQFRERLWHFVGRGQMDIDGMGEKLIAQLVEAGLVRGLADIFSLRDRAEQVLQLERMGQRKAEKLFDAIDGAKSRGLARVLAGLGIRHVGATASRVLAGHFGNIDRLLSAGVEELESFQIDGQESGIGPQIARSLHAFLHGDTGQAIVAQLRAAGVSLRAAPSGGGGQPGENGDAGGPLAGKTLVVTGALRRHTRAGIQERIRGLGGRAASGVSSATDFLIAGEKAGSKLARAQQLGVTVLTEEQFEELVSGQPDGDRG